MPPYSPLSKSFLFSVPEFYFSSVSVGVCWMYNTQTCRVFLHQPDYFRIISPVEERKLERTQWMNHVWTYFLRYGTLLRLHLSLLNVVPKSFHSISSLHIETVPMFPQMDALSLKYWNYGEIISLRVFFFFFFFPAYVCFYFFVKQKMSYFGSYIG